MRAWKELTTQALAGTAKSSAGPEAERQLLKEAGWLALLRLAGYRPLQLTPAATSQAPAETQPAVSRRCAARLEEILRTDDRHHLAEWLALAAEAGKLAPSSLLPAILDYGMERPQLRQSILAVGGERVRWLASANEDWAFAAVGDPEETFRTGIRAARVAALVALRRKDPRAALDILAGGWSKEGGDDRVALLPALAVGLGPTDEQFLITATKDGRKEVRTGAADLLARLPSSALIARMTARADGWIRYRKGMLGGKLDINPPTEYDAEMHADGVEAKPPKGTGERAHWLRQVLGLVPPSHWPRELVDQATKSDWSEALLLGWTDAAVRFQDPDWCELLIEHRLKEKERHKQLDALHALVRATPAGRFEAILMRHLQRTPTNGLDLVAMANTPISLQVSAALLGSLEATLKGNDQRAQQYWVFWIRQVASRFDPGVQSQVVALADKTAANELARNSLQSLAAELQYRAEMAKEIQS